MVLDTRYCGEPFYCHTGDLLRIYLSVNLCDIHLKEPQISRFQTLGYLANLCNSTIIEIYDDIIRVSHGFDGCQMLEYIAVTCTLPLKSGNKDITTFLRPLKVHRCWRYRHCSDATIGWLYQILFILMSP